MRSIKLYAASLICESDNRRCRVAQQLVSTCVDESVAASAVPLPLRSSQPIPLAHLPLPFHSPHPSLLALPRSIPHRHLTLPHLIHPSQTPFICIPPMQLPNPTPPILVHLPQPSPAQPHPALSLPHALPAAPALSHTWRGSDAFALTPFIAMAIGLAMIGLRAMGRALYSWVGRAVRAGPIIFQGEFSKLVAGLTSTTRSIAPGSCDEEGGERGAVLKPGGGVDQHHSIDLRWATAKSWEGEGSELHAQVVTHGWTPHNDLQRTAPLLPCPCLHLT